VANDLNKNKSDSSSSSVSGSNIITADFLVDNSGNDAYSSDELVAKLEENHEMDALLRNGTWEIVELPEGRKAIGSKWIYKIKFKSSGEIDRYKARLAPRQWNAKLTSTLIENRFSQSKYDYSLYTKSDNGIFLALLVYVDDIIITGNSISEIEKFKVFLKSKFMIKDLGLGIHIARTSGMFLNAYSNADWAMCIVTRKSVTRV
nr:ribonuclease H-like domain-containing protein [Tanacetum cinerariifolium]